MFFLIDMEFKSRGTEPSYESSKLDEVFTIIFNGSDFKDQETNNSYLDVIKSFLQPWDHIKSVFDKICHVILNRSYPKCLDLYEIYLASSSLNGLELNFNGISEFEYDQFRKFINFKCWYYFILEELNLDVKSNGNFEAIVEILPDCSKEEEFKCFTDENMKLIFTFEGAVDIEYKILEYLIKNHK